MQHKRSIFTWEAKTREGLINSKSFNWFDSKANTKLNFFYHNHYFDGKIGVEGRKREQSVLQKTKDTTKSNHP